MIPLAVSIGQRQVGKREWHTIKLESDRGQSETTAKFCHERWNIFFKLSLNNTFQAHPTAYLTVCIPNEKNA